MEKHNIQIGLFGGAFDPFHSGHLSSVRQALEVVGTVIISPSAQHPYGKRMAPWEQRHEWIQRSLAAWMSKSDLIRVRVSDHEKSLSKRLGRAIYSIDSLEYLCDQECLAKSDIALVVGQDVAPVIGTFHRGEELSEYPLLVTRDPQKSVHSSWIREQIYSGQCPRDRLSPFIAKSVLGSIINAYGESHVSE